MPMMPQAPPGAPPPGLMEMMAGGGGPSAGPQGPPNPAQAGPSGRPPGPQMSNEEQRKLLEEMIKIADVYRAVNTDPETLAAVTKVVNDLMKLIAMEQKQLDSAVGVGPQQKMLRRMQG
jgi:hypothetical protein